MGRGSTVVSEVTGGGSPRPHGRGGGSGRIDRCPEVGVKVGNRLSKRTDWTGRGKRFAGLERVGNPETSFGLSTQTLSLGWRNSESKGGGNGPLTLLPSPTPAPLGPRGVGGSGAPRGRAGHRGIRNGPPLPRNPPGKGGAFWSIPGDFATGLAGRPLVDAVPGPRPPAPPALGSPGPRRTTRRPLPPRTAQPRPPGRAPGPSGAERKVRHFTPLPDPHRRSRTGDGRPRQQLLCRSPPRLCGPPPWRQRRGPRVWGVQVLLPRRAPEAPPHRGSALGLGLPEARRTRGSSEGLPGVTEGAGRGGAGPRGPPPTPPSARLPRGGARTRGEEGVL